MSLKAITWAWDQDEITEQTDLLVLLAIADHADEHARCFPSQGLLSRKARCSTDTVGRALKRLEAAGFLTRAKRPGTGGGRSSDLYTLHLDRAPRNVTPTSTSDSGQNRNLRNCQKTVACEGDNPGENQGDAGGNTAACGGAIPQTPGGAIPHSCAEGTPKEPPEHSTSLFGSGSDDADLPETASASRAPGDYARCTALPVRISRTRHVVTQGSDEHKAWVTHLVGLGKGDLIKPKLIVPWKYPKGGELPWGADTKPNPEIPASGHRKAAAG